MEALGGKPKPNLIRDANESMTLGASSDCATTLPHNLCMRRFFPSMHRSLKINLSRRNLGMYAYLVLASLCAAKGFGASAVVKLASIIRIAIRASSLRCYISKLHFVLPFSGQCITKMLQLQHVFTVRLSSSFSCCFICGGVVRACDGPISFPSEGEAIWRSNHCLIDLIWHVFLTE